MKIAIFASAFYPHIGGVEELVRQLAREYQRRGIPVIVVTNRWPRSLPAREIFEGITVYRLPMRMPEGSLKARMSYTITAPSIRHELSEILRCEAVDILHVQCVGPNGFYALQASEALHLPLVVTAQGERTMDADGIYERSPMLNETLRSLLTKAACITACSFHTLRDLEHYTGTTFGERSAVIPNAIEPADFENAEPFLHPRPYILGIGRMVKQKGFDTLLEAFGRATPAGFDLLLAGDGPERSRLEQLRDQLCLQDRVRFCGAVTRKIAASLFKGCSFFVLPSRQEPFGIVNLEAMICGKAVIASQTGGVPEIIVDGETGLLVPPDDAGALAAAINELASRDDERHRLGENGRKRAQRFTWRRIAGRYIDIYEDVLSAPVKVRARSLALSVT
jgi:glycogen synthase